MRHRIRLRRPVRIADEIGGAAIAFADAGDVWAEIEAVSSAISPNADANATMTRFRVIINRRADIRAGWRITWGARSLRVVGARDEGVDRMEITCEEEVL